MSEVKRYAYGFHDDGYGGGRTLGLIEREDGELVTFADFDAQAAENARLRADNEALYRGLKGKHATTGATYEHLAAERDALRAQLAAIQGGMGENIEPCTDLNHHERYRAGWNACRAAMLAAASAQGQQVDRWVPVSERLPEPNTKVMAHSARCPHFWAVRKNRQRNPWEFVDGNACHERITHWMPLPAAPNQGGDV